MTSPADLAGPGARPAAPYSLGRALARFTAAAATALAALVVSAPALAHQASDAYLRASPDAQGRLMLQADVALRDLEVALELDSNSDGKLAWGEIRKRETEIAGYVAAHLQLDEGRCKLEAARFSLDRKADGTYAVLRYGSDCLVANTPSLTYRLFRDIDPTHRGLLLVFDAKGQAVGDLQSLAPGSPARPLDFALVAAQAPAGAAPQASAAVGGGFFGEGLHHILIGADHVLFLVCLMLPLMLGTRAGTKAASWRVRAWSLVALVTAFTLGHSVTLALASWRVLSVPASVIEPLIALTIALTALDNLWPFLGPRRGLAALGFGLIHGFGFAGPLLELQLPAASMALALLQFNLGVEAGQLVVVAVALLLLAPLGGRHAAGYVLRGGSVAAGLLALVWLGERLLDVKVLPI